MFYHGGPVFLFTKWVSNSGIGLLDEILFKIIHVGLTMKSIIPFISTTTFPSDAKEMGLPT